VDPAAAARRAVLDAIPPAPGDQGTASAQAVPALPPVRPSAPPRTARPAPSLAPVTLAPPAVPVGGDPADPVQFAQHPAPFATRIGRVTLPAEGPATSAAHGGAPLTPQAASLPPYERACQLEKDRQFVMSMCRDLQGRVWVGHLNHGVSAFEGQTWQSYEIIGGSTRSDALRGPPGERAFPIDVRPEDVAATFRNPDTGQESPVAPHEFTKPPQARRLIMIGVQFAVAVTFHEGVQHFPGY
jgi:hypothetical protein